MRFALSSGIPITAVTCPRHAHAPSYPINSKPMRYAIKPVLIQATKATLLSESVSRITRQITNVSKAMASNMSRRVDKIPKSGSGCAKTRISPDAPMALTNAVVARITTALVTNHLTSLSASTLESEWLRAVSGLMVADVTLIEFRQDYDEEQLLSVQYLVVAPSDPALYQSDELHSSSTDSL